MEPTKNGISVVKKGYTHVTCDENSKKSLQISLHSGNLQQISGTISSANSTDDDDILLVLNSVCNFFAENLNENSDIRLEIVLNFDREMESYKSSFKICLSPALVKTLNGILIEPKLCIQGDFIISYKNIRFEPQPKTRAEAYHARKFRMPPTNVKFSVSAPIGTQQLISDFEGSDPINDLMNGDYLITDIHIYHSVSLEWITGLKWTGEPSTVLEKLWNEKLLMDCVIIASNKAEVSCHRSILAVQSDVFLAMFSSGLQESQTNRINMEELSEEGVHALVQYFYKNEVDEEEIGEEVALELLQAAHKYNLSKLEVIILNVLLRKNEDWFSLEAVFEVYYHAKQIAGATSPNDSYCYGLLRDRMLNVLKRNVPDTHPLQLYQDFLNKHPDEAADLAFLLMENLTI